MSNSINAIFDKEKEQNRLKEVRLIGEIGSQTADIAITQGDINGLAAAKKAFGPLKDNATDKEKAEYLVALRNSDVYRAEMQKYGTGSALQQGIQAATAAVQGLAGGDLAKAIAGGSAPYIANIIGSSGPATNQSQSFSPWARWTVASNLTFKSGTYLITVPSALINPKQS